MSYIDPKRVALEFNEAINNQNLDKLASLMTEDHTFFSIGEEDVVKGRSAMLKAWQGFFKAYPDDKNHFTQVESRKNLVIMVGFSECLQEASLDGPAI